MKKAGEEFVKVRVVKMNGVDIGLFQFDFDLTWMCFFMNANGFIYGRYGCGRTSTPRRCSRRRGS